MGGIWIGEGGGVGVSMRKVSNQQITSAPHTWMKDDATQPNLLRGVSLLMNFHY